MLGQLDIQYALPTRSCEDPGHTEQQLQLLVSVYRAKELGGRYASPFFSPMRKTVPHPLRAPSRRENMLAWGFVTAT